MRYYVFCAGNFPENKDTINNALAVVDTLRSRWLMNATITGVYDGSEIIVDHNDGGNTSICMEDENLYRLIDSCMEFVKENAALKYKKS